MQKTEILLRFVRYTTGLSALCWDGTSQILKEFEQKHCFSRQAQPLLTADWLQTVLEKMQNDTLYEAADLLGIHLFFFRFREERILVGPFVTEEWSEESIPEKKRLVDAGLPASALLSYKLYYCSYCTLDQNASIRIVSGAITALEPNLPPYTYQRFSGTLGRILPQSYADTMEPLDFDSAISQIELEKQFFDLIKEGQTQAALEVWGRLLKIPMAKALEPFDLQRKIASLTGLRFLLQMIAAYSGIHPATVFSLSVSYGQKLYAARNPVELEQTTTAMIREFSEAIRSAHASHYSPAIGSVISYLNLHISQKPDLKKLAALADCTPEHLSQRFKAETGLTVAQYVAQERCKIAASLLRETDLPIQNISTHVGYLDSNYFVKIFRKYAGETPTDYRNQFRR